MDKGEKPSVVVDKGKKSVAVVNKGENISGAAEEEKRSQVR